MSKNGTPGWRIPDCFLSNPEAAEAFDLGLKLAKEVDADIVLATDPDAVVTQAFMVKTKTENISTFTDRKYVRLPARADYEIRREKR